MKKLLLVLMSCLVFFALTSPASVEAKRSGGYKSPTGSFKQQPKTSNSTNLTKKDTNTSSTTGTASTANRGFFSGGGLMKGLLIGGIAGMLFGGLFGGMGFLGNVLGFMVNMLAIFVLIMVIRRIVIYFKDRRKPDHRRN
ncbi:hypothetical protein [Paenibacillus eucommiae]|uniref:Lipid-binding transport protein (Tim44 family) n=1 Tax=Paenibacillus eucommiae TaxID=1355755 RepID=A0ABS4IS04_9BACL|nr:hypothetical protein [Paenibacillus eucommiae]MBP1990348.1 putative lipid-binding transport protein (Tim44 family) [Paenibacillus eucommiae]